MQLARDPGALLRGGDASVRLSLPLERGHALLKGKRVQVALADETSRDPGAAKDHDWKEGVVDADPDKAGAEAEHTGR